MKIWGVCIEKQKRGGWVGVLRLIFNSFLACMQDQQLCVPSHLSFRKGLSGLCNVCGQRTTIRTCALSACSLPFLSNRIIIRYLFFALLLWKIWMGPVWHCFPASVLAELTDHGHTVGVCLEQYLARYLISTESCYACFVGHR